MCRSGPATTDDTPVPPRVRARIFEAYGGICQCGCTRKIAAGEAWEVDHYVAADRGGRQLRD